MKGVSVREEELTKNYTKLVLAPRMGQEIMPHTFRESRDFFFETECDPDI